MVKYNSHMFKTLSIIIKSHIMKPLQLLTLSALLLIAQSFQFRQVQTTPTTYTINSISSYSFLFDRTNDNNYRLTDYDTIPVARNANVTITFPSNYTSISSASCLSISVDNIAINGFGCERLGNVVVFIEPFKDITNLYVSTVVIVVGNVLNPSPAYYTDSFSGTIGVDVAVPKNTGVQLTPSYFSNCSITFSPNYVYYSGSAMNISIVPNNPLPAGASLQILFPKSFWTNDISSQTLPINGSMSCTKYFGTNLSSGFSCAGASNVLINVTNIFTGTVSAAFAFGITNFLSPPSNQPSDSITITSQIDSYKIDRCFVYPTGLVANNFYSLTIIPITTMTVNSLVGLRFTAVLAVPINRNDYFSITFPSGTTFSYNSIYGISFYNLPPTISGQTVLIYHNSTVTRTFNQSTAYIITFQNFQAPPSTAPTDNITFSVLRNGYPIMTGNASLTAVSSTLNASVTLSNTKVATLNNYIFTITMSNPLSSTGTIQIVFPNQVTISTNSTNCATLVGVGVNQLPSCSYTPALNSINITNINGSSANIAAQTLRFTIFNITNPGDTSTSGSFSITTYYNNSKSGGITDSGTAAGITATIGTISINTVSVVPSNYTVLAMGVTYTISFNNTYMIPTSGFISIMIPNDITISLTSLPNYCKLGLNLSYTGTNCSGQTITQGNITFYQINFTSVAQTQLIPANTLISLQIIGLCQNPTNTRVVSPISITTFSASSPIETLSGITVQMSTPASFFILNVSRISQKNSALTNYTLTLKQQAQLPAGTILLITTPNEILMTVNSSCTNLSFFQLNCTQTSYQALTVILPSISSSALYGLVISNVRNPPSYRSTNSFFIIQTKTSDQVSSYARGTILVVFTNSQPSDLSALSYKFDPGAYGNFQSLNLVITPSPYINPTQFVIVLASSFTVGNFSCNSFVGFNGTCTPVSSFSNALSVKGMNGTSSIGLTIAGFTSPVTAPSDFTSITSYQQSFIVDQSTNYIKFNIECNLPCKTCTSNASACLTCYNISSINNLNLYFSVNFSCLSSCPSGYYATVTLYCLPCLTTCLTCSLVDSNCTSCNLNSSYPALNFSNSAGSCLSACPLFYYLSKAATPPQCLKCDSTTYRCITCSDINVCLSCIAGFYLYNKTCTPSCPASTTIPNNGTWICDLCSVQCATCQININNCTSCSPTSARHNGSCVTTCPHPLVINAQVCAGCDATCKTCSLVSTNCTACYTTQTLPYLSITNAFLGSCVNKCSYGYYGDITNGLCQLCTLLNIGCTNCSSQTTCYSCDPTYIFYNNTCSLTAPLGYYNNSGVASPCNSTCATCMNLANNCSSCIGNLSLSGNTCTLTCLSGQVGVSNLCTNCSAATFCKTCSITTTYCTSCASSSPTVYLSLGSCVPSCPNYTYPDSSNRQCQPCTSASHCQMCTTAFSCITCVTNYFLYNSSCGLTCPAGYIGLNRICTPCTNNCRTCSQSPSICLSCNSGYYLYNTTSPSCVNTCPNSLFMNNSTMSCTGCSSTCGTCGNYSNQCLSCPSGTYLQNSTCLSNCNLGYYPQGTVCSSCPNQCAACTSFQSCTQCAANYYLYINTCVTSCPASQPIVNVNGSCSTCTNVYCVNCNSSNYCSGCYFPQVLVQGTCMSSCPSNYSLDSSGTTCVYSPSNNTNETVTNSLTSSSVFPVPFTIAAGFIGIACLMSRFQHERTFIPGALYALWGLLQWGAICFFLVYYWLSGFTIIKLSYLLVAGGLGFLYLLNFIFLLIQNVSLRSDKRLKSWLAGTINSCSYCTLSILGLFTSNKVKNLLFCKLFAFSSFSAPLQNLHHLRSYYAFGFFAFVSSLSVIAGTCMLIATETITFDQLFMAKADVLILSVLQLIFAVCQARKDTDFFEDTDQDGIQVNRRVSSFDEVLNEYVQPQFGQQSQKSYLQRFQSARKMSVDGLADYASMKSMRDISIQAEQILGQRSLISHLGTEPISDFSMFQQNDISIQMDQAKQRVDVSVGQNVIFLDASINPPSLHQRDASIDARVFSHHDASINAQTVILQDVSIDQTVMEKEQVSVQYFQPNKSISIQFDQPSQHEISIQYVPLYTDQTVHMTRQEASLAIQCNAEHENVSIQYSAKPLFQDMHGQEISSETSLNFSQQQQPSDLDLQRRLLQGGIAPAEQGLKQELEIDINEKLERKQNQLGRLQAERWQREKEEAMKKFQQKIQMKVSQSPLDNVQQNDFDNRYNNQYSKDGPSSLMRTEQVIQITIPPRFPPRPPSHKVHEDQSSYKDKFSQEESINRQNPSNQHTAKTQQEIINMLSGNQTSQIQDFSKDSGFRRRAKVESGNYFVEDQLEFLDQDRDEIPIQLVQNTVEQFPSVDKSRSTANMTGRYGNPRDFILQDSQQIDVQKSRNRQESIIGQPLMPQRDRPYRHEQIDQNNRTNLNKFLEKKRTNSSNQISRKKRFKEEEDALARQLQQRPLPPQKSEQLYIESNIKNKHRQADFQFDNSDRIVSAQRDVFVEDALSLQAKKLASTSEFKKGLPKKQVVVQRRQRESRKGYQKQTYSSDQKRKSLQKIYMQKMVKK